MDRPDAIDIGLLGIMSLVFLLPLFVKRVGQNLEAFLFLMGLLAVTISGKWSHTLALTAATDPISKGIVPVVLAAGLIFLYGRSYLHQWIFAIVNRVPLGSVIFVSVVTLGLISSLITAVVASLVLVELLTIIPLVRGSRVKVTIIGCFSIGLGMVLTPVAEPLALVARTELEGPPYYAGFAFFFDQLALYILPGIIALGALATVHTKRSQTDPVALSLNGENLRDVFSRAGRIYIFVMALILLGSGLEVVIDKYLTTVPPQILYWVNMLSAVLDNATLTAAEITPVMDLDQIRAMLMGLLISGGMLIPGNIANIVASSKLGIDSREWSRSAVPLGLVMMAVYYLWIFVCV